MSSKWDSMFVDMAELGVNVDIETMPAQGEWGGFEKLLKDMGGPVQMETIDVPQIDPSIPDDQLDAPMFRAKRDGTLPLAAPEEFAVPIDIKYEDGSKPKGDKSKDLLGQYGYKPIGVNQWDQERKLAYASRLPYAAVAPDALDISQGPISTTGEFGRAAHAMGVPGTAESPVMRDKDGNVLMQKSALDVEIEGYSIPPSEGPMVEGTKLPLPGYAYYDDQTARQQMNELATGRPSLAYYRDVETAMERYEKYPTSENRLKLESELKAWRDRQNAINREVRSMEATGEERSPQDHVAEFVAANTPTLDPSTEGGNWFGGTTMGRLRAAPLEGLANFLETTVSAMALDGGQSRAE